MRSSETLSVVSGDLGCRGWKRSDFIGKPNRGIVCGRGREEGDGEPKNVILSFQAHLYFIYFLIPMRLHVSDLSWDTTWPPWTFDLGRVRGHWFPHAFLIPGDPTSMEKNGIWSPFPSDWSWGCKHAVQDSGSYPAAAALTSGHPCFQDLCF